MKNAFRWSASTMLACL